MCCSYFNKNKIFFQKLIRYALQETKQGSGKNNAEKYFIDLQMHVSKCLTCKEQCKQLLCDLMAPRWKICWLLLFNVSPSMSYSDIAKALKISEKQVKRYTLNANRAWILTLTVSHAKK